MITLPLRDSFNFLFVALILGSDAGSGYFLIKKLIESMNVSGRAQLKLSQAFHTAQVRREALTRSYPGITKPFQVKWGPSIHNV